VRHRLYRIATHPTTLWITLAIALLLIVWATAVSA
jgi:hypothetical protein